MGRGARRGSITTPRYVFTTLGRTNGERVPSKKHRTADVGNGGLDLALGSSIGWSSAGLISPAGAALSPP